MTKKLRYLCTLLLMAVAGVAWADDIAYYTLDGTVTSSTNTNYANAANIEVDGVNWGAMVNTTTNPWRIGGKSITNENRLVYTKDGMASVTTKVVVTLGDATLTVNSLKLEVATDDAFENVIDTQTKTTVTTKGDNEFTPTTGTVWSKGYYYRFTFNVTTTGSKNQYVQLSKIVFYKEQEAGEKIDPTVEISAESINVGETAQVTTNGPAVTLSSDDETVSISGTTITGVSAGSATITATWEENDEYNSGEQVFNITISDPNAKGGANNPYTVAEAIEYIGTLGTSTSPNDVYVKGIVSKLDNFNYNKITYWISDDGTTTSQMQVYNGYGLDGAAFTALTDLNTGDKVTVCGKVKMYNSTPEFIAESKIVSLKENTDPYISAPDKVELAYDATEGEFEASLENANAGVVVFTATLEEGCDWITDLVYMTNPITFKTSVNTSTEARSATITLHGTGAADKVVTITQEGAPKVYDNIADMFADAGSTATDVQVQFDGWTVTGVDTKNAYVTDGTNGFIIYNKDGHGFKVGNTLTSENPISCKLQLFKGSAELTELTASTDGLTIGTADGDTYANVDMADLSGVNTGALVSYENLTCSVDNGKYYLSDGSTSLQVYTTLYADALSQLEEGKSYNITGVYLQYNTTKEILPRSAADITEYVEETSVSVEIGEEGKATLYYSDKALEIPDGVEVTYVSAVSGTQITETAITGVIPPATGVIIAGEEGTYEFNVVDAANVTAVSGNLLSGSDEEGEIEAVATAECYYYKLVSENDEIGFYWGAEDGGVFTTGAHKAYLAVPQSNFDGAAPAKLFFSSFDEGISTGINNVEKIAENAAIYNLNGVRVSKMQKGVYVVNGKKVVVK